ncbi:MAG: SPFH domain-containing protein [Caldilineaceae bacterium]
MLTGMAGGIFAILLFVFVLILLRSMIRVCPSNHILVVTGGAQTVVDGRQYGFRLQKGGWTFVIPFIQSVQAVDLTIIPINVRVEGVNSANGINVGADATACVCIDDQQEALLYSAVQQLLGKSRGQIQEQIQQTMIGNFRAALNKTTPLQAIGMVESADGVEDVELAEIADEAFKTQLVTQNAEAAEGERAIFRKVLLEDCQQDLSTFGIEVVSVSLQRIWDTSSYIANLANKTLSGKRKDVEVEEARLRSRAERAESDAKRRQEVAESQANERILEVQQELEVFRRQCTAAITRARLESDSAIAEAESQGQRQVEEMKVELQQLKNRSEVTQLAEAQRRAAELVAAGEGEAVNLVQKTHNDLLRQKVQLLNKSGDIGKLALFVNQMPMLFKAYQEHAKNQRVNELLVLNEEDGFNSAVNRGPAALVNFLHQLEEGFGISIKQFMGGSNAVLVANSQGQNGQATATKAPSAQKKEQ